VVDTRDRTGKSSESVTAQLVRALLVGAVQQREAPAGVERCPPTAIVAGAERHRVAPAVYLCLRHAEVEASALDALRSRYEDQLVRHLTVTADLAVVAEVLSGLGATWVVMKGPVLADRLWPRPDMRQYFDLDILVEPRRFKTAISSLEQTGARLIDRNWPLIGSQHRGELSLELPYGTSLDLHWDLVNDEHLRRQLRLPVEEMLTRAVRVKVGDLEVPTFDAVDTLLSLAMHAAHAGATRLVWLKDVERAAAVPDLDWAEVDRRARAQGLDLALSMILDRAWRTLGTGTAHPGWQPAGGVWRWGARAVGRFVATPGLSDTDRTGQLLFRSVRSTSWQSAQAAWQQLRHPPKGYESEGNPLHIDIEDASARDDFFAVVEGRSPS
jgi:Uncharacterised nucleotidyltransferase